MKRLLSTGMVFLLSTWAALAQSPTHIESAPGTPLVKGDATLIPPTPPPAPANNIVLHDSLAMVPNCTYDTGSGNTCGGSQCFGTCFGLQMCDDFIVPFPSARIYEVTGAFLAACIGDAPPACVNITFYRETFPGSCEPENKEYCRYCCYDVEAVPFRDCIFGFSGWYITATLTSCDCVLPEGRWFVDIQPETCRPFDSDWFYQIRQTGAPTCDAHLRDSALYDECCHYDPGYGFWNWTSAGNAGYGAGDAALRVVACKEELEQHCFYKIVKATPLKGPCGDNCTSCRHQVGDIVCCGECATGFDCPGGYQRKKILTYCSCPGGGTCQYAMRWVQCSSEFKCTPLCP